MNKGGHSFIVDFEGPGLDIIRFGSFFAEELRVFATDHDNGCYTVEFKLLKAGKYQIHVK